ncbi:MAG: hypothetical protein WKF50_07510 [Nocardioides sp.]
MTDDTRSLDQLLGAVPVDPVPLARIRHDAAATRRRRTFAITGLAAATVLAVTVGAAALTGVLGGGEESAAIDPAAQRELAAAGGEPCPDVLPRAHGSDGFGSSDPAPDSPDLPAADEGWVCRYQPENGKPGVDEKGSYVSWHREGQPVALDAAQLDNLIPALTPPDVQEGGRLCPADLGLRWLLVTSAGGDLTGLAIDDFGCSDVRLTDDPAEVEPGEATQPGLVPGTLTAPDGFADALAAAFESGSEPASVTERLTIELGHCFVEPVAFDGEQWNVAFDQQFGWGGLAPRNWQGTGVMTRVADDEARFDDGGGATVRFLAIDDPAVTPVEEAICA